MATVFMKWLETSPKDYDRGIRLLTLGKIQRIKEKIVNDYVKPGLNVLEIGCGTGTLTQMMARKGAMVTAIDASPQMLVEAEKKIKASELEERVSLGYMDAVLIGERFEHHSFDLIVSTLVFSELTADDRRFVLEACRKLLKPGGKLLIADEVVPHRFIPRLLFYLIRVPLVLLTWLITRTTTSALREFDFTLTLCGFRPEVAATYLSGTLVLFEAVPVGAGELNLPATMVGLLRHRRSLRNFLLDLWLLFFRIIPPYPKVRTGLYAVGHPDADSPVLVTGNFDLTVRRLVRAIDGKIDAWLLVADSSGINVWCAAGGGYFTAEKIIAAIKSSHLEKVVNHRQIILPQLCANGVDGWRIRKESGWRIHWGPVRAADVPAYLANKGKKNDAMRWVSFPFKDRLEMVTVTMGFYGLLILLPVLLLWRHLFWPVALSMIGLSYFYAIVHPWLPGRDGLYKSIPLTLISLSGLLSYQLFFNPLPGQQLFHWALGLTGLSVFSAAELQGMSPLMRGEQANWLWEAVIGLILLMTYWLVPITFGWR